MFIWSYVFLKDHWSLSMKRLNAESTNIISPGMACEVDPSMEMRAFTQARLWVARVSIPWGSCDIAISQLPVEHEMDDLILIYAYQAPIFLYHASGHFSTSTDCLLPKKQELTVRNLWINVASSSFHHSRAKPLRQLEDAIRSFGSRFCFEKLHRTSKPSLLWYPNWSTKTWHAGNIQAISWLWKRSCSHSQVGVWDFLNWLTTSCMLRLP